MIDCLCRSLGGVCVWKDLSPSGTGPCCGGTGGGSQARSPDPCDLLCPLRRGRGKRGGGRFTRTGRAPLLTVRGGCLHRLPTEDESRWFGTPEPCPPGCSGGCSLMYGLTSRYAQGRWARREGGSSGSCGGDRRHLRKRWWSH